jgi:hypothetical protein
MDSTERAFFFVAATGFTSWSPASLGYWLFETEPASVNRRADSTGP